MFCAHAASNNLRILPALPARGCLVAERGVRGGEAALEEEIVGCLVAKPIGVLTPSPKVRILDRLRWQLRPKDLGPAENNRNCCSCAEKLKREICWWVSRVLNRNQESRSKHKCLMDCFIP